MEEIYKYELYWIVTDSTLDVCLMKTDVKLCTIQMENAYF